MDDLYPAIKEVVETAKPLSFDAGQYGLQTVLALPILRNRAVVGVLTLKREDGTSFTLDQREIVERVISRAAIAIENARLYAAVQLADKAKSEFVGIVAHDLKSPMTSILGYADLTLMHKENLTERQTTYLGRIHDTVKRMEILVSDLSDISRIESGQFYMDESLVTVSSIVETALETIMPQLQTRKHQSEAGGGGEICPTCTRIFIACCKCSPIFSATPANIRPMAARLRCASNARANECALRFTIRASA